MRIIGHGIDLLDLKTLRCLSKDSLLSHWARAFSAEELAEAGPSDGIHYLERLGGKFALKEAVFKACGTPNGEIDWAEIQITKTPTGQPSVRVSGEIGKMCTILGITHWMVSISHCHNYALGSAIAIGD